MHVFETKNDFVRRGILATTILPLVGLVVVAGLIEGAESFMDSVKEDTPEIVESVKKIWNKPL